LSRLDLRSYDTIVITYSMYCHCLADLGAFGAQTVVLITDLFGGPPDWFLPGAHKYIAPTHVMERTALERGIPSERILVRRLPTLCSRRPLGNRWGVEQASELRVLVIGGSAGVGPLEAAMRGLARANRHTSVSVVCGHNKRLRARIVRSNGQVKTLGFVDTMADRWQDFDLVVTKPGSVTLMELFDAEIPFILMPGIPGIEAGNSYALKRDTLPEIGGVDRAQRVIESFIHEDLSLSTLGQRWMASLVSLRDALPANRLTLAELARSAPPVLIRK